VNNFSQLYKEVAGAKTVNAPLILHINREHDSASLDNYCLMKLCKV